MVSKNKLVGKTVTEKEKPELVENIDWWPRRMFHKNCPDGERKMTYESQQEALANDWKMEKGEIYEEDEITMFTTFPGIESKIDLSGKKTKGKK